MIFLFRLIFSLVLIALAGALYLTWHSNSSDLEKEFAKGTIPEPALSGLYKGSVDLPVKVTWRGKQFDAATTTGINVFEDNLGSTTQKYPFRYGEAFAQREVGIKVIAIDYDLPENPFWMRPILDEIVQIAPGKYLGKLNLRIFPGYPFTLGFFKLEK